MKDFQVNFTADSLPYRTTIPAETDGQAQDKFVKWFVEKFKPEKGILGVAKVTKIVAVEKEAFFKKALRDFYKFWK